MADPVTFIITAASIPVILAGLKSGLQFVLDAMPEILQEVHDASTKRRLTKLNALFLKAQVGDFTEKDFQKAIHYYAKIETVAMMSQNEMMLNSLKEGLANLKATLVVKNLLDKKLGMGSSNVEIVDSKRPVLGVSKVGAGIIETGATLGFAVDELSLDPSIQLQTPPSLAGDGKLAKLKAWERPAMWSLVAVMPPLLFVPKIRHKC